MINELKDKISHYVKQKVEENNNRYNEKEVFLKAVYDTLADVEDDHSELYLANYEAPAFNLRVDGFDFVNDNSIDLYLALYSNNDSLNKSSLNKLVEQAKNFIIESIGDLHEKLSQADIVRELAEQIHYNIKKIDSFRIIVITNMTYDSEDSYEIEIDNQKVQIKVYDIDAINELNVFSNDEDNTVNIDFVEQYDRTINSVKNPIKFDRFDNYMMFVPALILATTYEKYGYSFLNGNVRAYLKKTQKVNKQIYETLENDPNYFVAYNNGLSTVASNIEIDDNNNISKIYGWQIVNGGQTTATIYEAKKANVNLSQVYVPVKLTLIRDVSNETEELISKISEYANTQSKVNQSDLSSNEKYHIELEKLSTRICIPKIIKDDEYEKWFYERTKNQYELNKSRDKSGLFTKEFPKDKKFTKVDLAKCVMPWEQEPHIASLGGEKNFYLFNTRVKANEDFIKIDENYFKKCVALYILFNEIDKVVTKEAFGGYKANIDYYVLSLISYLSEKKLNLLKIWEDQGIDNVFKAHISELSKLVYEKINETPANNTNVAMWCRNKQCWDNVRTNDYVLEGMEHYLTDEETIMAPETTLIVSDGVTFDLNNITSAEWFAISKWGKDTDLIQPRYRSMAYSTGLNISRGKKLTASQIAFAKKVLKDAYEKGFEYKEEEQ